MASDETFRPRVLSPFQGAVLRALSSRLPDFFLTGGSALAEFYLGHRISRDLDLFTSDTEAFAASDKEVRIAARDLGVEVTVERSLPSFRRYLFLGPDDQVVVDVVMDPVTPLDAEKPVSGGIRHDTLREIAVNKLCALLGRVEPRDLVDLYFIERSGLDPLSFLDKARLKDGGMTPGALAYALASSGAVTLPAGLLASVTVEEILTFRDRLVDRLLRMAVPRPGPGEGEARQRSG